MKELEEYAKQNHVPIIRPKTLQLLLNTISKVNPQSILEIGTAIGYSGINMLNNSNAHLTTIELDVNSYKLAKENFKKYNLLQRTTLINDDAKNVIEKFEAEKQKFDFIFLDGPKGQYVKYLPILLNLLTENGVLFADNVLFKGMVLSKEIPPHKHRTIVNNLRKYIQLINIPSLKSQIIDIEDGVAITKKEEK